MITETLLVVMAFVAAAAASIRTEHGLPVSEISAEYRLLLANGNGTIAPYTFNPSVPTLTPSRTSHAVHYGNATLLWLTFLRFNNLVYAVDQKGSRIFTVQIDSNDFALTPFDENSVGNGTGPTHAVILNSTRLITANYEGGSVSMFNLNAHDGSFTADQPDLTVILPRSVEKPRSCAHQIVPDPTERWFYVPDLCANRIYQFSLDNFAIIGSTSLPKGSGPRHFLFHRSLTDDVHAYLASENSATLTAFSWSSLDGALTLIGQPQSALPPGIDPTNRTTSEVAISPDGKYVYVGTRGDPVEDHVAIFEREGRDGSVKFREWAASGGRHLRHFSLSPDTNAHYIAAAHRDTQDVTILQRDPVSGTLSKTAATAQNVGSVLFAGFVV